MKTEAELLAGLKVREVRVYVWHSDMMAERFGHVAIGFDYPQPCYISLWPNEEDAALFTQMVPALVTSYEDDVRNEDDTEATHIFTFYTLANESIFTRLKALERDIPEWVLLPGFSRQTHNCATFLLHLLKMGGLENLVKLGKRMILHIQEVITHPRCGWLDGC